MKIDSKLKHNLIYQGLYQGFVVLYPLLTVPLVSKAFGSEVLGIYSYTYSIAYYFSLFVGLGINVYGSRVAATSRESKELLSKNFKAIYCIQLCNACFVSLIYIFIIYVGNMQYKTEQLLQGIVILTALVDISWFLSGLEKFKVMVFRNTLIKMISLILICICIESKEDLGKYILIVAGTQFIGNLSVWPTVKKYVYNVRIYLSDIKEHIKPVIQFFFPIIAINSYVFIDKLVLGIFRTINEVGYYENCDRLIKMPIGLSSAISAVLVPRAAYDVYKGKKEQNSRVVIETLRYNYIVVIPIIFGLIGITPEFVPWYMGDDFLSCIDYIRMLSPIIFLVITNNVLRVQYYVALKKDKEYITSILLALFINVLVSILLVKNYGVCGVIIGSLSSEILAMIYLVLMSVKELQYKVFVKDIARSILCSVIMLSVLRFIGTQLGIGITTNIFQIVVGICIYGGVYFLMYRLGRDRIYRNEKS